jgi:hypothetical protein
MKNIKNFNEFAINEACDDPEFVQTMVGSGILTALLVGMNFGYDHVKNYFGKNRFERAKSKLGTIFGKIKDDDKIQYLLNILDKHKDQIINWSSDDPTEKRRLAGRVYHELEERIKELLSEKDYKQFIDCCKDFEEGAKVRKGTYLVNKDKEYFDTRYHDRERRFRIKD